MNRENAISLSLLCLLLAIALLLQHLGMSALRERIDIAETRIEVLEETVDVLDRDQQTMDGEHRELMLECDDLRETLGESMDACLAALDQCDRMLRDAEEPQ